MVLWLHLYIEQIKTSPKKYTDKKRKICGDSMQNITRTRKGGYKIEGNYTKPYPSLHLLYYSCALVLRCRDGALYIPSWFVFFFLACHPHISSDFFFSCLYMYGAFSQQIALDTLATHWEWVWLFCVMVNIANMA